MAGIVGGTCPPELVEDTLAALLVKGVVVVVDDIQQGIEIKHLTANNIFVVRIEEVAVFYVFVIIVNVENDILVGHEEVVEQDGGIVGDEGRGVRQKRIDIGVAGDE